MSEEIVSKETSATNRLALALAARSDFARQAARRAYMEFIKGRYRFWERKKPRQQLERLGQLSGLDAVNTVVFKSCERLEGLREAEGLVTRLCGKGLISAFVSANRYVAKREHAGLLRYARAYRKAHADYPGPTP